LSNHSVDKTFPGCCRINVTGDFRAVFSENKEVVTYITIGTHSQFTAEIILTINPIDFGGKRKRGHDPFLITKIPTIG